MMDFDKMIDFDKIVERFGKPGTVVNMVSELALVQNMSRVSTLLTANVLFPRNVKKGFDYLIYNQEQATEYRVADWTEATWREFADEVEAIFSEK